MRIFTKNFWLYFFFCLIFNQDSFTQSDYKYCSPKNYWQYTNHFCFTEQTLFERKFSENVINFSGKLYYQELFNKHGYWTPSNDLYREENGKVFMYNSKGDELIMDTNLNVGDSIVSLSKYNKYITSIDEIKLIDGSYRKRFSVSQKCPSGNLYNVWVDGVGFLYDNTYLGCILPSVDCPYFVSCFFYENEAIFSRYNSCFYHENNNIRDARVEVFYNNYSNSLIVESPFKFEINIFLLNVAGYSSANFKAKDYTEFSSEHLPSGVYFYLIYIKDIGEIKGKFVKY
jgi:hypothetical protein